MINEGLIIKFIIINKALHTILHVIIESNAGCTKWSSGLNAILTNNRLFLSWPGIPNPSIL